MKIQTRLAIIILLVLFTLPVYSESIFLTDGSIIEGQIIKDQTSSLTILDKNNTKQTIQRSRIMRILYIPLKKNKIYIQKRDGKGLVAYMVDEDRETYTFRKDLYKPEEFVIDRKDVLFMSEKNPSGLRGGDIGIDRVTLSWIPPYDIARNYTVYMKKNEKDKYAPVEKTKENSITIKKLTGNTTYYFIVTSTDNDNNESAPSNEFIITTMNILPDRPEIISVKKTGGNSRNIVWKPAADPDGKVAKYRLYGTRNGKRDRLAELTATQYMLNDVLSFDRVELVSVDDKEDESAPIGVKIHGIDDYLVFRAGVFIPLGEFSHIADPGYGGTFSFTMVDVFTTNLELGAEAGFYYISGGGSLDEYSHETEDAFFAPVNLFAGYRFIINRNFSVMPAIAAGAGYFHMEYTKRDKDTFIVSGKTISETGPDASAGFTVWYLIDDSFMFTMRIYAGYLVGTDAGLFTGCDIGLTCGI